VSIELNTAGVACNIGCTYCYENPMRDAGNINVAWDWEKVRAALDKEEAFSLHGGEPLLAPISRIEQVFEYGYKRHGHTGVQTNGTLITDAHIAIFKKYNTFVGISCDGPEQCSDARAAGNLEQTRAATKKTIDVIERLLNEGVGCSLITTLWKGNCDEESFKMLCDWFIRLDKLGMKWVNLHYLEIDGDKASKLRVEMPRLIGRMKDLMSLERQLKNLKFTNFGQYVTLLRNRSENTVCVWHACDVLTTPAVQGIDGQGDKTNCGRTNKDGVNWLKASTAGIERQHALYNTPYRDGGCKGCRFFLMCKGECPGTGLDGDWRNRTEHCEVIMAIFEHYENLMLDLGETPASLHPDRIMWERKFLDGQAPSSSHGDTPHGDSHGDHTDARVQAVAEVRNATA
jgi:uncharacterized protein